jgi:hypothetical protein
MPSLEAPGSKKLLGRQVLTLHFGEPLEMFDICDASTLSAIARFFGE